MVHPSFARLRRLALIAAVLALWVPPAFSDDDDKYGESEPNLLEASGPAACVDGFAAGFPCQDVDLLAALPLSEVGGVEWGADMWGWVDPVTRREYAIYAHALGTAFIDITQPTEPVYLGLLPVPEGPRTHGDIKVYRGFAFIVGERTSSRHGLLVFDLRRLRRVTDAPVTFTPDAHYREFDRCHNLALNEETGFLYAVSTTTCQDGLHMLDVRDPTNPRFAGCVEEEPGTHDAQCVTYRGPDSGRAGREICFVAAEDGFAILDVTDKSAPVLLSRSTYDGLGYVHQGWLTEDQEFFLLGDEADEQANGNNTRTYVFDVRDLDAPSLAGIHTAETAAIDHNLYVRGDYVYQANYNAGLRILRLDDPSRGALSEVAYFDTVPDVDRASFASAWTAYPYFPSGTVAVSALDGLYLLRPTFGEAPRGCDLAATDPAFCDACGPCSQGEGRCVTEDECLPGLACAEDFGAGFDLARTLDVCVAPRSLASASYSLTELSAVTVGDDRLDAVVGRGINNAGQVVGEASNGDPDALKSVAFRYSPGTGMEVLDPGGALRSQGFAVNENGDVYGHLLVPGTRRRDGVFLHRDGEGFNRLKRRADATLERGFVLSDMNDHGDLAGDVFRRLQGRRVPYLFTAEDGWQVLDGVEARFRQGSATAYLINNRGDVVFSAEGPGGSFSTYLWRGATLSELGSFGTPVNLPSQLNERGDVVGMAFDGDSRGHAYLYHGGRRKVFDLHPKVFEESAALAVTRKGLVAGEMSSDGRFDTLFTYDQRRRKVRQVVVDGGDFEALLPAGAALEGIRTVDVNERLEFVGRADGSDSAGNPVERWFYFSQPLGLLNLQDLVERAGSSRRVTSVVGLNDWGAILLGYEDDGGSGALVLTPVGF